MVNHFGVKIALLFGNHIVTIQRDNKPGLDYADMWELPGGGCEGSETPLACITRELYEELNIQLPPASIVWHKPFTTAKAGVLFPLHFMVGKIDQPLVAAITLGKEGQGWKTVPIVDFLFDHHTVPVHQHMLRDYLQATGQLAR